ncbi:DUF4226 domain-containing protein [Mycobacterium kansasii]|uniref:Biofilm regulator BssS n=6 Tax=Mycobacterium kansasii TaxID=1768 RepID=A0A653ER43_MYCKA|nr:DUF4226 domain-containing protein [Mycobacterium kansasii]AGZ51434.1 hypothetical protein MKAN_15040 [Mycobacterium kansasii ATCC 12478]ARG56836.1 hypothetical protein B1T43_14245 [Mycobacterium kansasii]ARG62324.1 hypothetical protein B1T45_14590 [Mycobacterium kansasii]ARG69947.1 hypothetical protein B1T47_13815 [Mycobacterium kansasii]ARG75440.1 hypothetical protein B1T51_14265 [Mycobacterium kansasii]
MAGSRDRPQRGESASAPPDSGQATAADAIAGAEAALAHQNSVSSQLDLQVVSAILNAHLTAVEGRDALNQLQQETEAAVRTRSDLDTPAGARDFQRFLIGKLRDIREVVANASLDDTSKATLMAAWTSLYNASKNEAGAVGPGPATPARAAGDGGGQLADLLSDDPLLDSLLFDDPALPDGEAPMPGGSSPAPQMAPTTPGIPNLGGVPMPGLPTGATSPMPGLGWGGSPLSGLLRGSEPGLADRDERELDSGDPDHERAGHADDPTENREDRGDTDAQPSPDKPDSPPTGPTAVTLPNGETVTAANPQLAAAIKAAAGGVPIPDAFQQQGIALPPPGTPVTDPIDPARLEPGDIGFFVDRHTLALGRDKALLDGQIQQVSSIGGPSFLGWEHPPATATSTGPARAGVPTPTRPAAPSAASQY